MLHTETIEARTLALLRQLINDNQLQLFSLAGGTALALQLGHRKSIDIDLFTENNFDAALLAQHLTTLYNVQRIAHRNNAVACFIKDVKVDILAHQYPLINKIETIEGIRMYSLEDIAAMKLNAIVYNGTRIKDFADMHKLLEYLPLQKMTDAFTKKYPAVSEEMAHSGLKYHDDINKKEKIAYIGKDVPFNKIEERLKQSVAAPAKIFKSELGLIQKQKPQQGQKLIPKKTQRKRNGLNP